MTNIEVAPIDAPVATRPNRQRRPGHRHRGTVARRWLFVRTTVAVVVCAVMFFPLYWMIIVSFTSRRELLAGDLQLWPSNPTLENFRRVFDLFPTTTWFVNSLAITLVTTVITVAFNLTAGFAFAQLRFRGRNVVFLLTLATLMLPIQVIMVPQFQLVTRLGIYGTYWAVILPTAASAFGIFLARQFIISIPRELIEAARVDGAGHFRVFRSIVLPLCKPLIAVLTLLTVLSTWNDFAWPLIALKENELFTLPIGLLYLQGQFGNDYGGIMAFALLSVLPMVALFLLFQRHFVQGFARSGIR